MSGREFKLKDLCVAAMLLAAVGLSQVSAQNASANTAAAPSSGPPAEQSETQLAEVIVTANKRSQPINEVGMSITAISGSSLQAQGVNSPLDLGQVVPGLTVQPTNLVSPVYTLRGVGFYEATLSAAPAVMVYVDEVPIPFSAETKGVGIDVDSVEVLEGPQGTLFGSNTTGGAINYIANKPTDHFEAGIDGTYGRFETLDSTAYVSGPVSDTLKVRLAVRGVVGDGWQYDYLNNATLGRPEESDVRFIADWQPIDSFRDQLTVTGWKDTGDTQAPQVITDSCTAEGSTTSTCSQANPYEQLYRNFPPPPPGDPRAAAWGTVWGKRPSRDDWFYLLSNRIDYQLTRELTLTSISAYSQFSTGDREDFDGTPYAATDILSTGWLHTIYQELRLSGNPVRWHWLIGANYERSTTFDDTLYAEGQQATNVFYATGGPIANASEAYANQTIDSKAGFGNAEFAITDALRVTGGLRYTETDRDFQGCTEDDGDGTFSTFWDAIFGLNLGPGDCTVLSPYYPNAPQTYSNSGPNSLRDSLDEHNVSWSTGMNYKLDGGSLLYYRVAQGYKAGEYPNLQAASYSEYKPVKQEGLLAYEIGAKVPAFDKRLFGTIAAFYYDYTNKQLKGREPDPIFGSLDALVQIPRSYVEGVEVGIKALPITGLRLSIGATYAKTEITQYDAVSTYGGAPENYAGQKFPYSPPLTATADVEYDFAMTDNLDAFLGTSATYNSRTSAVLNNTNTAYIAADHLYDLPGYYLLNFRAGVQSQDGRWTLYLWGRNVTNRFYSTNILNNVSTIVRYTGMPATFGAGFGYKFR
jgi:outer membrane receptor protein involved in Fe transport